jgi:hypothetical protein
VSPKGDRPAGGDSFGEKLTALFISGISAESLGRAMLADGAERLQHLQQDDAERREKNDAWERKLRTKL